MEAAAGRSYFEQSIASYSRALKEWEYLADKHATQPDFRASLRGPCKTWGLLSSEWAGNARQATPTTGPLASRKKWFACNPSCRATSAILPHSIAARPPFISNLATRN